MKVRDKFRELVVLELTDVSCKGIEVLATQKFMIKYLRKREDYYLYA